MIIPIILLLVGLVSQIINCVFEVKNNNLCKLIFKSIASILFVLTGIFSYIYSKSDSIYLIIIIALIFGMVGDIILDIKYFFPKYDNTIFLLGMISFLIGHIFYLVFLINKTNNILLSIFITLIISIVLLFIVYKKVSASKSILILGGVYLTIIVLILVLSIVFGLTNINISNTIFMIGMILFVSSDIILAFNEFGNNRKEWLVSFNLIIYYIGQSLIALSICLI